MQTLRSYILISTIGTLITACGTTGPSITALEDYVKKYKYEPLIPPRDSWGTGTIIRFADNVEHIVARRDECLNIEEDPKDRSKVVLAEYSYEIKSNNSLDLNLGKAIDSTVNLKAVFESGRVHKVKISFGEAFAVILSEVNVKQKIKELEKEGNKLCLGEITEKGHSVITRALGVKSIEYSFYDEKDRQDTFDIGLLTLINVSAGMQGKYVGKTSLSVDSPVLIGYGIWEVGVKPGFLETEIAIKQLDPNDIKNLKQRNP